MGNISVNLSEAWEGLKNAAISTIGGLFGFASGGEIGLKPGAAPELDPKNLSQIVGASAFVAATIFLPGEAGALLNYRGTFFKAFPELEGEVIVHHAAEQQILKLYPGLFSEAEIHSLANLRGIPKGVNGQLHLSEIRKAWNAFYLANPNATKAQILQKAGEIDRLFGSKFLPQR